MMVFGIDFGLGLARRTKTVVEPGKSSSSKAPADKFSGIGFASQPNPVSQVNCSPSVAPTAGASCPSSDASCFFNAYLYDYLLKQGLFEVARLFVTSGADLELAGGPKARMSVAANPILNIHKRRQSDGSLDLSSFLDPPNVQCLHLTQLFQRLHIRASTQQIALNQPTKLLQAMRLLAILRITSLKATVPVEQQTHERQLHSVPLAHPQLHNQEDVRAVEGWAAEVGTTPEPWFQMFDEEDALIVWGAVGFNMPGARMIVLWCLRPIQVTKTVSELNNLRSESGQNLVLCWESVKAAEGYEFVNLLEVLDDMEQGDEDNR
ncbi:hypothetical protein BY996DRAFT_8401250 [Phakopsora pachyrhizi]|nr:hypothetical protein BY996DRAFT_8401250 [Phakopsora pachyrhizi]